MDYQHEKVPNVTATDITPHVVIFPLPIQGPVNCMLKLAELILSLSEATISVTVLNTDFIQRKLDLHSTAPARLTRFGPCFRFETVPDGLGSYENPRGVQQLADMTNYLGTQAQSTSSRVRELLAYGSAEPDRKPVTCIIADGLFWFMADFAKEIGIPLVYFETVSPCGLWTYLCMPKMLQAGDLPFQGEDLDVLVKSVPVMGSYLRRRDLPSFCRAYGPNNQVIPLILKEAEHYPRAQGHILNTFDDLEGDLLADLRASSPNLYNIGPLHLNLMRRLESPLMSLSNSIWQEDRSCLTWLDGQPPKSVLFVSIGSLAVMTKDQVVKFWYGLVNSRTRFLWVRRPNSIKIDVNNEDQLETSDELLAGLKDRGYLVTWVPQEEVLTHRAIGGFLTHSGWNSTLESIAAGVPMICWPFFADQQVNSRFVSEIWKIGLDMKDTCNRVVIEMMIKDLLGTRKDEFLTKADDMAKQAAQAVGEGGSFNHLNRLIDNIKFLRF